MTNLPVPYRLDFFNELGKTVDLTVTFERRSAKNRNSEWLNGATESFKAIFLHGISIGEEDGFCPEICGVIQRGKFDAVIVGVYHTLTSMLAIQFLKAKGLPYYISSDGGFKKSDKKIKYMLKRHFLSGAKGYFSPSQRSDEYLSYYGADMSLIYRYPFTSLRENDILENVLTEQEKMNHKRSIDVFSSYMILGVGQFIERKGWDILIKAATMLPAEISIVIVGGEVPIEYIALCKQLKINNIQFVSFKKKSELADFYCAADLFVLPTREDIWGLVINEALAYGLPVITTEQCNAGIELIEEGITGRIIRANEVDELAQAITDEYDNRKLSPVHCLKRIKTHTIENMAARYYERLKHDLLF